MAKRWLLVCLLVALLLSGCGQGTAKGPVTFMVFGNPAELQAYQTLVDAFRVAHPEIEVDLQSVASQSDYQKQIVASMSTGNPPDVMLINYRNFATFAGPGGLEPLDSYIEKSDLLHPADFYEPSLTAFQYNGQQWCIPQNISSLVVYYNRNLFDAAGIPYPAAGWTWGDFLNAARALTRDADGDGTVEQFGVGVEPSTMRVAPFIWQNGGELVDDTTHPTRLALDTPEAMSALQWFVDLQVKEHVAPDAAAEQAEDMQTRFLNGRLGMYLDSRKVVPTMRTITTFDWDVAPLPAGAKAASILHSDAYCMAAVAKNKEAAWTLIEYANSVEGQKVIASTGRTVPSMQSVAESPAFLDPGQKPASSQVYLDVVPTLRHLPIMNGWTGIEGTLDKEIERAFYGQATVEEAVQSALSLTEPLFGQAQK